MDQDAQQLAIRKLVDLGLLTQNQLTKALEYQCRLPPGQFMSLLDVIREFDFLTDDELQNALGEDYGQDQDPIGRILVAQGIVSATQLEQALQVLNSFSRNHVTDILIDLGLVTRADIERAISLHQIEMSQKIRYKTQSSLIAETQHQTSHDLSQPLQEVSLHADEEQEAESLRVAEPTRAPQVEQAVVHLPLGRQLIAKGYISEDELRDAIEYQQRLPRVMHRPIGEILVMLGYIDEVQLKEVLAAQPPQGRSRIGEILIQEGLIEDWQLAHALSQQFSPQHAHKKLGLLLVELGYASRDEIEGVLSRYYRDQAQTQPQYEEPTQLQAYVPISPPTPPQAAHKPLGQVLVEKGYILQVQLTEALEYQASHPQEYRPIGDILVLLGHLSEADLQDSLAEQPGFVREPIGQILIRQGLLQDWQLSHALCVQFEQPIEHRKNIGAILVDLGYCEQDAIETAILDDVRRKRQAASEEY